MNSLIRVLTWAGLSECILAGCASAYLERAPPSPSEPSIPGSATPTGSPGRALPLTAAAPIDNGDDLSPPRYGLAELAELAATCSPNTRIAWEQAREAALNVGVAKAPYFPSVAAVALGAYQHSSFPASALTSSGLTLVAQEFLPGISLPPAQFKDFTGHIGVDTFELLPFLAVRWQLLDWSRGSAVTAAEQTSVAANEVFVGEHQKLLFHVARAFFLLSAARAQVAVAKEALDRTRTMAKSADGRYGQGIATAVEVAEARRGVAQADYDVIQARAAETTAYTALLIAVGIDPRATLAIETIGSGDLREELAEPVDPYLQTALTSRRDLQAIRARLSSAEARVNVAVASYVPKISVVGTGGMQRLGARASGSSFQTVSIPNLTALVSIDWLLFDGGARDSSVEIARVRQSEADLELQRLRLTATQEVLGAYHDANAALARYRAAQAVERTALVADVATAQSYAHGLSTLAEAANAQRAHFLASAAKEQAYANARISATALAFAAGQLSTVASIPDPADTQSEAP